METPSVRMGASPSEWRDFVVKCDAFFTRNFIPDREKAGYTIDMTPSDIYGELISKFPDIATADLAAVRAEAKRLIVSPVPVGAIRANALRCAQKEGKRFRFFHGRVRNAMVDGEYELPCPHATVGGRGCGAGCDGVSYRAAVTVDILIAGIHDADIKSAVMALPNIHSFTPEQVVEEVERREVARGAAGGARPKVVARVEACEAEVAAQSRRQTQTLQPLPQQRLPLPQQRQPQNNRGDSTCACGNKFYAFSNNKDGSRNLVARPIFFRQK